MWGRCPHLVALLPSCSPLPCMSWCYRIRVVFNCPSCSHNNPSGTKFCESCGSAVIDPAIAERIGDEAEASMMLDEARKAKGGLLLIAVIGTIGGLVETLQAPEIDQMAVGLANFVIWGLFYALAFAANKRPLISAIGGLVIFLGLQVMIGIADPSALGKGIIVKIIFFAIIARAIKAGLAHRNFVRETGLD